MKLTRLAEQLERLAPFMSRPDARLHVMEKAAEYKARAALVRAGAPKGLESGAGAPGGS